MLVVDVLDRKRNVVGKIDVKEALLKGPINRLVLSDVVRAQLANARQGNAATKTRSEVSFSTRKIYRQKGTGNARHGSRKAPTFVGGGTVFGPHPRDYTVALSKKVRRLAFLSALRLKWKDGKVLIVNDLTFSQPKTKEAVRYFRDLEINNAVVVLPSKVESIEKSIRNIPHFSTTLPEGIRVLDLLKSDYLVFSPEALKSIENRLLGGV